MKLIVGKKILAVLLACVAVCSNGTVRKETPEEMISQAKDGNFLNEQGEYQFLMGAETRVVTLYSFSPFPPACPSDYKWLYEKLPDYHSMKRIGFNTMAIQQSLYWARSLSRDYSGPGKGNEYQDLCKFIKEQKNPKLNKRVQEVLDPWKGRINSELYPTFLQGIKMPLYIDACNGAGHIAYYPNAYLTRLLGGESAFSRTGDMSSWELLFSLSCEDGRAVYKKMWRYAAEDVMRNGTKALCYELFNEPRYRDNSAHTRRVFAVWLKEKYKNVDAMNLVWHSQYVDFDHAANTFQDSYARDYPGLAVDWAKFQQELVIRICEEGRKVIREVDPAGKVCVQINGGDTYRRIWNNFDLYQLSNVLDMINSGTGGFCFTDSENNRGEDCPTIDTPVCSKHLRESLLASRVWMALAKDKPLVEDEFYTGLTYQSIHSRIWSHMIRGQNAIYLYMWGTWSKNKEIALRAPFQLMSRFLIEPNTFRVVKECRDEIDSLADFFLPRENRPEAQVALLFSYPTIRYDSAIRHDGERSHEMTSSAVALTFSHFPFDVVFEESLKAGALKKYKVVLAQNVSNVYPDTIPVLKKYVEEGGILIAGMEDMRLDEYGNTVRDALFNLSLENRNGKIGRLDKLGVKAKFCKKIINSKGWTVVDWLDEEPAIVVKNVEKGRLYFIAAELPDYSLAALYQSIFKKNRINPIAVMNKEECDECPANVEVHKAIHDGMTAWYFMNCDAYPKIVKVKADEFMNAVVVDPFDKKRIQVEDDCIFLLLPSRFRKVIVSGPSQKISKRFGLFPFLTRKDMHTQKRLLLRDEKKKNIGVGKGRSIDLMNFCNKGIDNQQHWAADSAWFDEKHKYLIGLPWNKNVFDGVICNVIRNDYNENRCCIAMKSRHLPDGFTEVKNIPIEEHVEGISFFQAVTFAKQGETVMTLRMRYADDSVLTVPVVVGKNTGDWRIDRNNEKVKSMLAWSNEQGLGFFHWKWKNPSPEKELALIDIIAADGESTPIILAITAHPQEKKQKVLTFDSWTLQDGNKFTIRTEKVIELRKGHWAVLSSPDNKALDIPKNKLRNAAICYDINNKTDEWGNWVKVKKQRISLAEMRKGKLLKSSPHAREKIASYSNSNFELDSDPSSWQAIRIPIETLLLAEDGSKLDHIIRIYIGTDEKNVPVQIRNLRIEYDE